MEDAVESSSRFVVDGAHGRPAGMAPKGVVLAAPAAMAEVMALECEFCSAFNSSTRSRRSASISPMGERGGGEADVWRGEEERGGDGGGERNQFGAWHLTVG